MRSVQYADSATNTSGADYAGCPADEASETQQLQEVDFSFDIWRMIFKAIAHNEKRAMDTWETIGFEVEVTQRGTQSTRSECIVKVDLVCEPGKPARLLSPPQQ